MATVNQGELLMVKRKRLGLSQEDFAKKIGISGGSIKRYEASETIKKKKLEYICSKMKWDLNEFYAEGKQEQKPLNDCERELLEMHRKYNELRDKYEALQNELKKSGDVTVTKPVVAKINPVVKK